MNCKCKSCREIRAAKWATIQERQRRYDRLAEDISDSLLNILRAEVTERVYAQSPSEREYAYGLEEAIWQALADKVAAERYAAAAEEMLREGSA